MRKKQIREFTIDSGQTLSTQTREVESVAFGGVHVSAGLNAKTLEFYDLGPWGRDLVLSKDVTTGFNAFSDAEARAIGPSILLELQVTTAVAADSTAWLKLKS